MTAQENSKAVKKVLAQALRNESGTSLRVRMERGTAYGWINAMIETLRPTDCQCTELFGEGWNRQPGYCPACKSRMHNLNEKADTAIKNAKQAGQVQFGTFYGDDGYNTEHDEYILQVRIA